MKNNILPMSNQDQSEIAYSCSSKHIDLPKNASEQSPQHIVKVVNDQKMS